MSWRFIAAELIAYDRRQNPRWTTVGLMTSAGALFVYDGDCAFCTSWVQRLERVLDVFPPSRPWQKLALAEVGLTEADVTHYAWLLTGADRHRGHAAFAAVLRMQPSAGWRFFGHLLATPPLSWAAAAGYALIARYRHRLPGGTAACAMPQS